MKAAIISVLGKTAVSKKSHNAGWTFVYKSILEKDFEKVDLNPKPEDYGMYDMLFINEGVNFKPGSWNLFGGFTDEIAEKLKALNIYEGAIRCWGHAIPDYQELIDKRSPEKFPFIASIESWDVHTECVIIGDSHAISVYQPGCNISRNDGKTLFGFMRDPITFLDERGLPTKHGGVLYFGNIDVRFHLPRQKDPIAAAQQLAQRYALFCKENGFTPVELLPIEAEDRKIPGTGKHKGNNFYGSRALRMDIVREFNKTLRSLVPTLWWPPKWYKSDFDMTTVMEARQSVHLAPEFYMNANDFVHNENKETQTSMF